MLDDEVKMKGFNRKFIFKSSTLVRINLILKLQHEEKKSKQDLEIGFSTSGSPSCPKNHTYKKIIRAKLAIYMKFENGYR